MELRSKLLQSSECTFDTEITADYGDKLLTYAMRCQADAQGNIAFSIIEPNSIADISGKLSGDGGKFTFDDTALCFEFLADGQLAPISAPWVLLKALRSGYIVSSCKEGEEIQLSVDDTYGPDTLRLDFCLNSEYLPVRADILYGGRRILSVAVTNFVIV